MTVFSKRNKTIPFRDISSKCDDIQNTRRYTYNSCVVLEFDNDYCCFVQQIVFIENILVSG